MAVFNPQIQPTQDFQTNWGSKPIDSVGVDSSFGVLLKGAGELLQGGVQVVDTAIKKGIQDEVYKQVDPKRDDMTQALEKVKEQTQNTIPAPAQTAEGGKTWLDSNAQADAPEVPEGIEQGLDKVKLLTSARGAAKINDTQYAGEVLAIAKNLRSQYGPGYRDYVDQQISSASGLPVANAYYQNLITDINRQLSAVGKTKDGVDALVMKNLDVPGIQTDYASYKAGKLPESSILDKIATHQQMMTQFKVDAAKRSESTDNKKVVVEDATKSFNTLATGITTRVLSDVVNLGGINTKVGELTNYFSEVAKGNIQASGPELTARKQQLDGVINDTKREMWTKATEGGANSIVANIGADEVNKVIEKAIFPLQTTATFAGSKEDGPAAYVARQVEAIKQGAAYGFLINKDTSQAAQQLYGARTIIGDQYLPSWISNMVSTNVDKKFKSMFEQEGLAAISPVTDARGTPLPRSLKQAITHAMDQGVPEASGIYGAYTGKIPSWITDPNMSASAKDRLIDWTYNPNKNRGVLSNIKNDYRDPQTNQEIPGKHAALNDLTSPAMVDSIAETAKAKPENYQKFMTTVQGEFQTIARTDIQDINKLSEKSYLKVGYAWDEKNNRLSLVGPDNRPIVRRDLPAAQYPDQTYLNTALDTVDRLNGNIARMAYAHSKNPDGAVDTTKFMYDTFRDMRANKAILGAIIKSRNPDVFSPVQNFTKEEDNSLQAFLRSPAGQARGQDPQQTRGVIKGNLSDEQLVNIQTDEIPADMSARDFIKMLRSGKRPGGSVQ